MEDEQLQDAIDAGAALRASNAKVLMTSIQRLLHDAAACDGMGKAALLFANQHRGATQRTMLFLRETVFEIN